MTLTTIQRSRQPQDYNIMPHTLRTQVSAAWASQFSDPLQLSVPARYTYINTRATAFVMQTRVYRTLLLTLV